MQVIESLDYYLLPIYLLLFYLAVYMLRNKFNSDKSTYKIYYAGVTVKLIAAMGFAMIAQYYYGYGDSLNYFDEAKVLHNHIVTDPANLKYFFNSVSEYRILFDPMLNKGIIQLYDNSNLFVIRLTTIFTFFSGNTYLTTTLFFVLLSFSGIWAIFKTFITLYPKLKNQFAWGILFLPSVSFWSSGVMKDSICIAALGWLFYSFYSFFINKKRLLKYSLIMLICIYVIWTVKFYILIAFAFSFLIVALYFLFIRLSKLYVKVINLIIFILTITIVINTDNPVNDALSSVSVDFVVNNIKEQQRLYNSIGEAGEGNFDFGDIDPTLRSLLAKVPEAITTVLFRPYIWESKKLIMFFAGLENSIIILITIYVIWKAGLVNFFKLLSLDSLIQFCFVFMILFAIIVGLTSFNFGTMIRYKVPCVPFYLSFLIMLNYKSGLKRKQPIDPVIGRML